MYICIYIHNQKTKAEKRPKQSVALLDGLGHVEVDDSLHSFDVPSSFLFLLVRHLLLEARHLLLVASCSY